MKPSPSTGAGKLCQIITRAAGTTFLLTLPLGYVPEATDTTDVYLGVHGGAGNVVTVLRDCNNNAISSVSQEFTDVSGSVTAPIPGSPFVFGLSGGAWFASGTDFHYTWINPHVSLETRMVGVGLGYVGGDVPLDFGNYSDPDPVRFSGHLRLGNPRTFYLRLSMAEQSPLISGGGILDAGVGFPVGSRVDLYSALTVGFYDQPGFAQHARFRLSRTLDALATARVGEADNKFEGSAALGLLIAVGR